MVANNESSDFNPDKLLKQLDKFFGGKGSEFINAAIVNRSTAVVQAFHAGLEALLKMTLKETYRERHAAATEMLSMIWEKMPHEQQAGMTHFEACCELLDSMTGNKLAPDCSPEANIVGGNMLLVAAMDLDINKAGGMIQKSMKALSGLSDTLSGKPSKPDEDEEMESDRVWKF